MTLAMIGPWQFILILLPVLGIFFLGYYMGKKAGYIKRVKEMENK
jgi:hypothetical protein